jgi:hypothetical protein
LRSRSPAIEITRTLTLSPLNPVNDSGTAII